MAADPVHAKEASPSFVRSDDVFCNSECHCCSVLKRDFQVFVNEIKWMTEIINHLEKEQKYYSATKQDRMLNSACEEQPKTSSLQCCNCSNLENQLKDALHEVSSVKEVHTTHGIPVACRYVVLSNRHEPQKSNDLFPSNSEHPSRVMPINNHQYVKRLRRK